ncbi:Uncharacterized protein FWK35_00019388 [Aphis craccivora]|uniref:Uncharacterized protein n=1 Tax=Aphis craccivora TaxID=307492 RepID=A0A6G0YD81_APHCR|nr:Uncharacterized protein FWK35_00019388 [Aphis craccivora]
MFNLRFYTISELGHQVTHVHNIKLASDKLILSHFFAVLKKATNILDLHKIDFLLHTKVVIEKPYPLKSPPQCYRCLSFGHNGTFGVTAIMFRGILDSNTQCAAQTITRSAEPNSSVTTSSNTSSSIK